MTLLRRSSTLEECSALCQDSLKCVDIFLRHFVRSWPDAGKLESDECTRIWTEVPSGDKVTIRRLVIDLCRCGKRHVEFRREMEMEIEVFLRRARLLAGGILVRRSGGHHQQ